MICPIPSCPSPVPPGRILCAAHWLSLSWEAQRTIQVACDGYRLGMLPRAAFVRVRERAIALIQAHGQLPAVERVIDRVEIDRQVLRGRAV